MATMACSAQLRLLPQIVSSSQYISRNPERSPPFSQPWRQGWISKTPQLSLKCSSLVDWRDLKGDCRYSVAIEAKKGNPPVMPAVMTPGGPLDLSSVLFRNRIIFIGQPINSQVAQRVISQLVTLAAIDENADILVYLNCPGGSTYSVLAIYDCMSWIKPKVGTVCFGVAASQGALLLAGGEKGMRYAMPNARIMIHQPQSGCGGHVEDVRRQVNEAVQSRHAHLCRKLTKCMLLSLANHWRECRCILKGTASSLLLRHSSSGLLMESWRQSTDLHCKKDYAVATFHTIFLDWWEKRSALVLEHLKHKNSL